VGRDRRFTKAELAAVVASARNPASPAYSALEAKRLTESQVEFVVKQIDRLRDHGSWNGDPHPTEIGDLVRDLRSHGLLH
jgi:hypothetical protein